MIDFIDHPPQIFVVGVTRPIEANIQDFLAYRGETWNTDPINDDPESLIELAGRACYTSYCNPAHRKRQAYLQEQLIAHQHGSVLEHVTFNLMVADLPRSSELELIRHRVGTANSWESTRFTDRHLRFVIPPRLRDDQAATELFKTQCHSAVAAYEQLKILAKRADPGTLQRKRPMEAARSILGDARASDGMWTINVRTARHVMALRSHLHADLSIREFARAVFAAIVPYAPACFADAHDDGETIVFTGGSHA